MYMMIFRVVLMPALVLLSFFTGWRMAVRMIADDCQRFGGFVSGNKEYRCISTMQMWLLHECPDQRIYIAGPMSGLPENNYPAFHDAAERMRNRGWHVENPAENPAPHSDAACEWTAYMRMGITQLMTCHAIYLLPGWEKSPGASVELFIAKRLGLTIYEHARQDDVLDEHLQALVAKASQPKTKSPTPAATTCV